LSSQLGVGVRGLVDVVCLILSFSKHNQPSHKTNSRTHLICIMMAWPWRLKGYGMDATEVVLNAPVRGEWAILNPPGHAPLAFDFLATKGSRLPYSLGTAVQHLFAAISVEATYAWKQPVFAPADGVVVGCSNSRPDRQRISLLFDLVRLLLSRPHAGSPFSTYGGNYVLLKCGNVYPLLAHLACGSVRVKVGDYVRAGDQLGLVGNSGISLQPHLHFQVMRTDEPFPLFHNLVPFCLRTVQKRVGREWHTLADAVLHNGDHLRL
jgi:hypothetical protein